MKNIIAKIIKWSCPELFIKPKEEKWIGIDSLGREFHIEDGYWAKPIQRPVVSFCHVTWGKDPEYIEPEWIYPYKILDERRVVLFLTKEEIQSRYKPTQQEKDGK